METKKTEGLPILTRAESEVMQALWEQGEATVQELVRRMKRPLAYNTVLTTVRVLEKKGYVEHVPAPEGGRAYLYRAAVEPKKARSLHVRDLIDRLFGGSAQDLVTGLVKDEQLERDTLEALRREIDARLGSKPKGSKGGNHG